MQIKQIYSLYMSRLHLGFYGDASQPFHLSRQHQTKPFKTMVSTPPRPLRRKTSVTPGRAMRGTPCRSPVRSSRQTPRKHLESNDGEEGIQGE